nr:starch-binding protein [Ruminococcus bromii]
MKTKISHLGRSTVSVILAVMMLLSTMLIGTITTANAVDLTKFSKVYLDANVAKYNANTDMQSTKPSNAYAFDGKGAVGTCDENANTTSDWPGSLLKSEGNGIYSILVSNDATKIIFNSGKGGKQTGNLILPPTWKTTPMIYRGSGTDGSNGWEEYTTSVKVADSVTLAANPTSVKVGKPVTLTPKVSGSKLDNLNYTYNKISGGAATEVKNADNSLTVTPTVAGTYKYTVTVSADSYSPVTSIEASFTVTDSDKYYIGGRFKGESWNPNRTDMQFVKVDGESNLYKYETNMTVSQLSQNVDNAKQYFFIHTGNGNEKVYYASSDRLGHTFHKNSINNQLTLKYYPTKADDEKNYIKFDDVADSSSNVVLYLDTSDKDNLKLYYSADIEPDYRITGNLSAIGEWNGYDSALKFDTAESDGSYSKVITVTDDDVNNKFFKLIKSENGSDKYYGPNDSTYDIISSNSSVTAYDTFEGSGEGNDFYFSKAGTYKIHYIVKTGKNTPSVWVEENTTKYNVTVAENIKSIASVDKTEAAKGEKVTVTATPETGKVLDTVTVVGENGSTPIETTVSGNTATFTMPDQDVTVTNVTFRTANTYTVKFSSSDNTFGTVSAKHNGADFNSGTTVTEGDEVTFTAKPANGYALSGWTVKVNGESETRTEPSLSLKITADTTVTANFKVEDSGTIVTNMYFLYGSKNDPTSWEGQQGYNQSGYGKYNVYEKDGKYIVTLNKEHYKQLYFAFSTSNYYKNMTPKDKLAGVNPDNPVDLRLVTTGKESFNADNTQYVFGMMSIVSENSEYIGDIKIIYDPTANTYTVKATKDSVSDTTVNIVGKDGTVRANYYGKTTSALGDTKLKVTSPDGTTITAIDSCNFDGHCQGVTAKKVPYGSTVTVTTTINPDATFAGHNGSEYYVKGFSINGFTGGVLTQQDGSSHTDDVYEYTFTVKDDVYADVSTIEITPIYFLKNDSNCVTFYVENFMEAKAKWGDTIACYAYYSSGNDSGNALGDYPGQPMVNAEGSIYMQIPKHIGNDTANVVKGITLNNYVWDFVHVSGGDDARKSKNCQTYDYDDFKYLANMSQVNSSDSASDIKNIVYRFKYHTYNNTSADAGNVPNDTLTATTVDNAKYEVFVDYYDKPTDIFGTIIKGNDAVTVDTVKTQSEYLTIVSDGYVNYYKDSANYLGQYATKWYIYNKAGQKVAALPPSALLYGLTKSSSELENLVNQDAVPTDFMSDSGASTSVISGYWASFKLLYNSYAGKYAIINYESAIYSSGRDGADVQPGERCDGRWYYSVDNAKITGDIKIEYANTLDNFTTMTGVKTDTFIEGTATGKNTAAEAYFTSPAGQSTGDKPTHVETTSDNSENFKFTVGATSSTTSGYTFVGWYRLIDDTYKAVNDPSELNKTTGQVARNANVVLVARYIKTPGGSMTFHHSLYNGTNAGGGKATTEIQVVVKSSDGNIEYYNSGRIDSTASIDKKTISDIVTGQQDAKITVTLYTTTKNLYDFKGYYSAENTTDITAFAPTTDDFTTGVSGNRRDGLVTTSEYTFSFNDYYTRYSDILTATDAGTVYYNFYSDITSIKVPYKVQFSYTDRMGEQKYYNKAGYVDPENTSSYTFDENATNGEGVESHSVKVTLTNSFILSLAPYESNFTKNLTWNNPTDSKPFDSSNSKSIASAVVKSTQSDRTIHLNVFRDNDTKEPTSRDNQNGAFVLYEKGGSAELPYGSVFYTKNDDGTYTYDITAPKTYKDNQFMYWAIYSDEDCNNLVIKAYNSEGHFSYVAYDNCWIVPVYGESSTPVASVKDVYTSTQFMEVTRNQWTADTNSNFAGFDADDMTSLNTAKDFIKEKGEDKLYADFVLNFFYNGKQLSVFDPNSENVKAGVLIQRLELDENETGTGYITDLDHYAKKYNKTELDAAKDDAINKIKNNQSTIKSVKQQIDNSKLDNKNRLQYYTLFNNVKGNNNCVFRLYTYIQYTDASGETVVELSNPVYFTFYDIANKS